MVILIIREMASIVTSRQVFQIAISSMVEPTTIYDIMPIGTTAMTTNSGLTLNIMDTTRTAGAM